MNYGFFGFPSGPDSRIVDVAEFDASGYYSVPMKARTLLVFAVGAGGGGGSGRRATTAANAGGGGGGGGGAQVYVKYILDDTVTPGSQLNIVIGAGGNGGASITVDNTNGSNGIAGGDTYVKANNRLGFLAYAQGGNLGSGGTTTGGAAGAVRGSTYYHLYGVLHGGAGSAGAVGVKGTNYSILCARASGLTWHGGSGGGGFSNPSSVAAGCDIIAGTSSTLSFFSPIGAATSSVVMAGGTADGGNGTSSYKHILGRLTPGIGGAGGGGSQTVAAGTGGNGYRGSGGGGGGGSKVGFSSGAGGKGGNGYVCIVAAE